MFCMGMVKNECDQSGHQTLKLTVSQKWTNQLIGGYVVADSGSLFSGFKKTPLTMQSYRMNISLVSSLF